MSLRSIIEGLRYVLWIDAYVRAAKRAAKRAEQSRAKAEREAKKMKPKPAKPAPVEVDYATKIERRRMASREWARRNRNPNPGSNSPRKVIYIYADGRTVEFRSILRASWETGRDKGQMSAHLKSGGHTYENGDRVEPAKVDR